MSDLSKRITSVRDVLSTVRHAALATVNEDGSPHNSPLFAGFDERMHMYWSSHPQSLHSKNIDRTGQGFIVVFDSLDKGCGLYIKAKVRRLEGDDLTRGLAAFNEVCERVWQKTLPRELFSPPSEQRLYEAEPLEMWVNVPERDPAGHVIRDNRYAVTLQDLNETTVT